MIPLHAIISDRLYLVPEISRITRWKPFVRWVALEMSFLVHGHESRSH